MASNRAEQSSEMPAE